MTLFIRELQKLLALTRSDPKSLMAGVIAPTVVLLIFAITFGNFAVLTLAVVDEDAGPLGAELTDSVFSQTSPLGGQYFEAVPLASPEAHAEYEAGRVNGILHIPEDFSAQLQAGEPGQIDYHFLNYNTDMAKNLRLYLDEGILDFYSEHLPGMDLQVEQRMAVDAQLDWSAIIAVGILLLAFLMGAMFNFLYLFNLERVHGTLIEYRLAPRSLAASFAARLVVALLAGAVGAAVNAVLLWVVAGVNVAGHLAAILPLLLVLGVAFVSLSALISLLIEKFSGAAMLSMISAVVIWFLSGATTSVKYATGPLLDAALALPSSYGLSQIRASIFGVDQSVGGLLGAGKGWAVMLGYAVVLLLAAYMAYRRRLTRTQ